MTRFYADPEGRNSNALAKAAAKNQDGNRRAHGVRQQIGARKLDARTGARAAAPSARKKKCFRIPLNPVEICF